MKREGLRWEGRARRRAAALGSLWLDACYTIGTVALRRTMPRLCDSTALQRRKGMHAAQYNLGLMFEHGQGVAQDYAEAVRLYRLAAAQGHAGAQNNLGYMFENGQGVAQDYAEAVRLYRLAAAQGHAGAQINLGYMFEHGQGVAQDRAEAIRLYRLAAAQGNANAAAALRRLRA